MRRQHPTDPTVKFLGCFRIPEFKTHQLLPTLGDQYPVTIGKPALYLFNRVIVPELWNLNEDAVGFVDCCHSNHGKTGIDQPLGHALVKEDRKSTRLNSSHVATSYAVFCLKKKRRLP